MKTKNPIEVLLGSGVPECRVISDDISVHWFKMTAKPGDACECGETVLQEEKTK